MDAETDLDLNKRVSDYIEQVRNLLPENAFNLPQLCLWILSLALCLQQNVNEFFILKVLKNIFLSVFFEYLVFGTSLPLQYLTLQKKTQTAKKSQ